MILGFVLILIVLIPFCIYLYITNKELKIKVEKLEQERKEILERKIRINKEQDTLSIENVSKEIKPIASNQIKYKNIDICFQNKPIQNLNCRSGIPIIPTKKQEKDNTKNIDNNPIEIPINHFIKNENYLKDISDNLNKIVNQQPIQLTEYEQEQENNAIISYDELKSKDKEKLIRIDENDEPSTFIENLKDFRNNLNS